MASRPQARPPLFQPCFSKISTAATGMLAYPEAPTLLAAHFYLFLFSLGFKSIATPHECFEVELPLRTFL